MNTNILTHIKEFVLSSLPEHDSGELIHSNSNTNTGRQLNRSIKIDTESGYAVLVLPADYRINYKLLKKAIYNKSHKLDNLFEVERIFPDYAHSPDIKHFDINKLPVYIYFENFDTNRYEDITDAGNFLDVMVSNYKH